MLNQVNDETLQRIANQAELDKRELRELYDQQLAESKKFMDLQQRARAATTFGMDLHQFRQPLIDQHALVVAAGQRFAARLEQFLGISHELPTEEIQA